MCNSQNEQLLREAIAEKIQAGQPFTIWDITSAARRYGADEQHWQMKNAVVAMFRNGEIPGYDCSMIQTPTGPARCFHPLGADLSAYAASIGGSAPAAPSPSGAQPAPAVNQTATAVADAADDVSGFERKQATDAEGRLPIWSDMLRALGLTGRGLMVYVQQDGDMLFISEANIAGYAYSINKDGRIRIGSNVLVDISKNASGSGTYNVKLDSKARRIEISAL